MAALAFPLILDCALRLAPLTIRVFTSAPSVGPTDPSDFSSHSEYCSTYPSSWS